MILASLPERSKSQEVPDTSDIEKSLNELEELQNEIGSIDQIDFEI
jgi:hypothetical protein